MAAAVAESLCWGTCKVWKEEVLPVSRAACPGQTVCGAVRPHTGGLLWSLWPYVSRGPLPSDPPYTVGRWGRPHWGQGALCLPTYALGRAWWGCARSREVGLLQAAGKGSECGRMWVGSTVAGRRMNFVQVQNEGMRDG